MACGPKHAVTTTTGPHFLAIFPAKTKTWRSFSTACAFIVDAGWKLSNETILEAGMVSQYASRAPRFAHDLPAAASATHGGEPEDAGLIAAAQQGDATAYGSLVRKYQQRLCY